MQLVVSVTFVAPGQLLVAVRSVVAVQFVAAARFVAAVQCGIAV